MNINSLQTNLLRELKKGLCIHANTSGSDSPTDPKLASFSHNRMPLPGHSWLLRNCLSSGGEKVEATMLFLVNIRKERTRLHPGTAYTGTWRIFGKDNPQRVGQTTPKRSQGVKKLEKMTKVTFLKNGKNLKIRRHFGVDFTDFVGEAVQKQTHFLRKNMFYHPVSVHHLGWVGLAVRCTQRTMGL